MKIPKVRRKVLLVCAVSTTACNTMLSLRNFEAVNLEEPRDASTTSTAPDVDAAANRGSMDTGIPTKCEHPLPEDCTNGIDDDCNGLIDCADPACASFHCVPTVPTGWFGPVALWQAAAAATAPPCPSQYNPLIDARAGLNAGPANCTCTCSPSGQMCLAAGVFHADQTCADVPCARVTPSPAGTCTTIPPNLCGSGGSFDLAAMPSPSGGRCAPNVVTTIPPVDWGISARICSFAGLQSTPGGCPAGAACLDRPASPYGSSLCIYSSDDPPPASCPAGYDGRAPIVLHSSVNDSRGCGACTCSNPSGGLCTGSIGIFADSACAAAAGSTTYRVGTSCQGYMGVNIARGAVRAELVVTPGTCLVDGPPSPAGAAVPAQPTTVCCL